MIRDKFFYNDPTYESVEASEMRMDEERPWPQIDKFKEAALSYVDQILEVPLSVDMWTDEQTLAHMELKKTPSVPWRYLGFKTRKEFFDSPIWSEIRDDVNELALVGHLYRVVPKDNWSGMEDFHAKKTRTFLVPGAHVLYWQLRCYGAGTEAIKNFSWSKYGFNPFNGNVHRLACRIIVTDSEGNSVRPIREWHDIAGYDRFIYLRDVALRRLRFFKKNKANISYANVAQWITDGLIRSIVILTNGDIIERQRGNNSGSGLTTANNIEAGFEVICDLLIYAYYMRNGTIPSFNEVFEQMVCLYGDDNLAALYEEFSWFLHTEMISTRLLYFHGLKMKIQGGGRDTPLNELSFLGFNFFELNSYYIPKWNLDRLLLPLTYQHGATGLPIYLQRFYSIVILSFAHTEWEEIRSTYLKVLAWSQVNSGDPLVKSLVRLGAPTRRQMTQFYLGVEAGGGWPKNSSGMNALHSHNDDPGTDFDTAMNYKGAMLDYMAQKRIVAPVISTIGTGPAHRQLYVGTMIKDNLTYTATAMSKKEVEQILSYKYLRFRSQHPTVDVITQTRESNRNSAAFAQSSDRDLNNIVSQLYVGPPTPPALQRTTTTTTTHETTVSNPTAPAADWHTERDPRLDTELMRSNAFWIQLVSSFKDYADMCDEEQVHHPLHSLFGPSENTRSTAARLAAMFKAGSFNPYGNGQQDTYTLQMPTFRTVGSFTTCSSTNLIPDARNVVGQGVDRDSAFQDWKSQIDDQINLWNPPQDGFLRALFIAIRQTPPIEGEHIWIWGADSEVAYRTMWTKFKEGGFNPYGNGQPSSCWIQTFFSGFNPYGNGQSKALTYAQWHKMNEKSFNGVAKVELDKRYQAYLKRHAAKKVKGKNAAPKTQAQTKPKTGLDMSRIKNGKLSGCAGQYMAALTCPFYWQDRSCGERLRGLNINPEENPCIPMFPSVKSRKFYAMAKGTFGIVNSGDTGWILMAPWRMFNNPITTNDTDGAVLYSTIAAWPSKAFPTVDTGATTWTSGSAPFNTDYTKADLLSSGAGVGVEERIVSCALRVRYVGNAINLSGLYKGVTEPNHQTLSQLTEVQIGQYDSYFSDTVANVNGKPGKWFEVGHTPVSESDFQYHPDPVSNGIWNTVTNQNHYIGIMLSGVPAGADFFQWEAICHFEANGARVRSKTATPCDPAGTAAVNTAVTPETIGKVMNSQSAVAPILKQELGMQSLPGVADTVMSLTKLIAG